METFGAYLLEGNARGTGFVKLPKTTRLEFGTKLFVKIISDNPLTFFAKVIKSRGGAGFYVPEKIATNTAQKELKFIVEEINGFYSKVTKDARINVPEEVIKVKDLRGGDAVVITSGNDKKYSRISWREKKGKREYGCSFLLEFAGETKNFEIQKLEKATQVSPAIKELGEEIALYADYNKCVAMDGKKRPVIVNDKIGLNEIAHYLGAYYADGTKIGNNWGICASTPEQGRYYLASHENLIQDSQVSLELSYTETHGSPNEGGKKALQNWNAAGIGVEKLRVRRPRGKKDGLKRSEYGSLVIKENRKLTQLIYNKLLEALERKVGIEKDEELAIDFILGVIEGDGAANSKKHGHVLIASNSRDIKLVDDMLNWCNLKHKIFKEKGNKWFARIHALSLLQFLPKISEKIFKYYPKRRKKFIERFLALGICRYLLGEDRRTSSWTKALLRQDGFLDENYEPTVNGQKLVACLIELEKELQKQK